MILLVFSVVMKYFRRPSVVSTGNFEGGSPKRKKSILSIAPPKKGVPKITKSFFSKTTAHGFRYFSEPKASTCVKVVWGLLLLAFTALFIWNTITRISEFQKSRKDVSYSSAIKIAKELEFPDVSICMEGYSNEFLLFNWLKQMHDESQRILTDENELKQVLIEASQGSYIGKYAVENIETLNDFRTTMKFAKLFSEWLTLEDNIKSSEFNTEGFFLNRTLYALELDLTMDDDQNECKTEFLEKLFSRFKATDTEFKEFVPTISKNSKTNCEVGQVTVTCEMKFSLSLYIDPTKQLYDHLENSFYWQDEALVTALGFKKFVEFDIIILLDFYSEKSKRALNFSDLYVKDVVTKETTTINNEENEEDYGRKKQEEMNTTEMWTADLFDSSYVYPDSTSIQLSPDEFIGPFYLRNFPYLMKQGFREFLRFNDFKT